MDFTFATATPPFFHDNDIMYNGFVLPVDAHTEIQDSWNQHIDPQLRSRQTVYQQPWQNQPQQPLQRFINAPERPLFTAVPFQPQQKLLSQGAAHPTSSLPRASNSGRMVSPAPSQDLTSVCSSARSPAHEVGDSFGDLSYYSPQSQTDFLPAPAMMPGQDFLDFWSGTQQSFLASDHVNMSQVQSVADPFFIESDDRIMDHSQGIKAEPTYESQIHVITDALKESSESQQTYSYPEDEGLGDSIKDATSPANSSSSHVSDLDAEGEAVDEDDMIKVDTEFEPEQEQEEDDDEYQPRSRGSRKRRSFSSASSPPAKRNRQNKATPKSRKSTKQPKFNITSSTTVCPSCSRKDFKDRASLQEHIENTHLRPYTCVFSFSGCSSTFATKNEWKRHVSTQHLHLHSWICTQGNCASLRLPNGRGRGNEFNRKDLYSQHVRRMHIPDVGKVGRASLRKDWEEQLKEWQKESQIVKRVPPTRLKCPVKGCEASLFEGANSWDKRMEHVAKHLEKACTAVRQGDDLYLVSWAVKEGIVVRRTGGGYRFPREGELAGNGGRDADAEGEAE